MVELINAETEQIAQYRFLFFDGFGQVDIEDVVNFLLPSERA